MPLESSQTSPLDEDPQREQLEFFNDAAVSSVKILKSESNAPTLQKADTQILLPQEKKADDQANDQTVLQNSETVVPPDQTFLSEKKADDCAHVAIEPPLEIDASLGVSEGPWGDEWR